MPFLSSQTFTIYGLEKPTKKLSIESVIMIIPDMVGGEDGGGENCPLGYFAMLQT